MGAGASDMAELAEMPSQPMVPRPDISALPKLYQKVLVDEVEKKGWKSMKWKDNFTMLHWAAKNGREDLCSYLLQLGANPAAKDKNGQSSVDVAAASGFTQLAEVLQEAMERGDAGDAAMRVFSTKSTR